MGYSVIIPAAGVGKRMKHHRNKLFIELQGQSILERTLNIFETHPLCDEIIIAVNKQDIHDIEQLRAQYTKIKPLVEGGVERQHSIYHALKHIENDIVMVHDAARPFVMHEQINMLYQSVVEGQHAVLGVRAKDTIKIVDEHKIIKSTLDRNSIYHIQTPQAFTKKVLTKAYDDAFSKGILGTDDASLVEQSGIAVAIVEGTDTNIKITTPIDIQLGELILQNMVKRNER